ncbi:hypothetical protein BT63DRAFT_426370 [Microthyrium microscopicum]|uniref:DUF7730 domain-containing protein n=1 Tax=Microthyrium microscopicum TaxID=703497 RepID=A0A6A6U7U3_9PEZI|nr:hypothetical protein BT63DRAFT_426370 [Microthyrium microscopicum]
MAPARADRKNKGGMFDSVKEVVRADLELFHIGATISLRPIGLPQKKTAEERAQEKAHKARIANGAKRGFGLFKSRKDAPATKDIILRNVHDQTQSRFLQLPPEIRKRIWLEVVGGHLLFGGAVANLQHDYVYHSSNDFIDQAHRQKSKSGQLLDVLLTCHKIYDEAIDILYSSNIFYYIGVEKLGRVDPMSPRILPPTTNLRSLVFECNVDSVLFRNGLFIFRPSSAPFTAETWDIFQTLSSLQILLINFISHVAVFNTEGTDNGNSEDAVFDPLKRITNLEKFEVVVRWKCPYKPMRATCKLQNDYSDAPFRLTEILDHVVRDEVIHGSRDMIDVRDWASKTLARK